MIGFAVRYILALCLAVVLVLPQATAALSAMNLADGGVMVICTGDGLRTISMDAEGEPVDILSEGELCALVNVVDTSRVVGLNLPYPTEFGVTQSHIRSELWPASPSFGLSHPRAPPTV